MNEDLSAAAENLSRIITDFQQASIEGWDAPVVRDTAFESIEALGKIRETLRSAYDSRPETYEHIQMVRRALDVFIRDLLSRSIEHDDTKLVEPELSVFNTYTPKLKDSTYGSDEYKEFLVGMGVGLTHHYAHNDHHPEWGERPPVEWRPCVEFPDYLISNYGDVQSTEMVVERPSKGDTVRIPARVLKVQKTPKGYLRIQLGRSGASANRMVHRLVAEAFIPNPENKPEVNHRNGDKSNNQVSNLEWMTPSENQIHAYDTGLKEPAVKYVVHCPELNLTTLGTEAMERALKERGYDRAASSGVWSAMDRGGKHLDLTFEGTLLAEVRRSRLQHMTLVQLLEMLCDWRAATMRHADGDLERSISINAERFGYGPEITGLLLNTARSVGWIRPK